MFTGANLLQINATIITGLLILFTVQSITTDSLSDISYSAILLEKEEEVLGDILQEINEAKSIYDTKDENGTIIIQDIQKTENQGEVKFSIPLPLEILEETEAKIKEMSAENYIEKITITSKAESIKEQHPIVLLLVNPQYFVAILIVPFSISMIIEVIAWMLNIRKIEPNAFAMLAFLTGLFCIAGIFGVIFFTYHVSLW
jgi:hypothetical protein